MLKEFLPCPIASSLVLYSFKIIFTAKCWARLIHITEHLYVKFCKKNLFGPFCSSQNLQGNTVDESVLVTYHVISVECCSICKTKTNTMV